MRNTAVEDQHGVGSGSRDWRGQRSIRGAVVDRVLEASISARAERIEQNPV
jgi:hypothetical protein